MRAAADARNGTIGENNFEAEHVIARHAVFQTARAAGVGGDVSADGAIRAAGGIGGVKQSAFFDCFLQGLREDAGLNHRDEIIGVDFLDAIHVHQAKGNAAMQRHATANITKARAAGRDGKAMLIGEAQQGGNALCAARQGHGIRQVRGKPFVTRKLLTD